jgi:ArsR family transcriptional regulator, arsenate/arsenite/antimonite-responsive transcriptional repressor
LAILPNSKGLNMDKKTQALYEARARIIKAMAHPSRLFIIEELKKNERSVGELTELIGSDTSTVSKHLSVLKNSGIIVDERRGTSIIYQLKTPCILNFIECIEEVMKSNANNQIEILKCCKI